MFKRSEPNIQQIPIGSPEYQALRDIAEKHLPVVDIDYSEIEQRVLEGIVLPKDPNPFDHLIGRQVVIKIVNRPVKPGDLLSKKDFNDV